MARRGCRKLSALSDCGSHVGCAGRLGLSNTASQRKAQAGAVEAGKHPQRGSRWGSRCEGWAQSCPVHNMGSPAPSSLGHLLGLDSQPLQPQALPCPVAQSLGPSPRVPWGNLGWSSLAQACLCDAVPHSAALTMDLTPDGSPLPARSSKEPTRLPTAATTLGPCNLQKPPER